LLVAHGQHALLTELGGLFAHDEVEKQRESVKLMIVHEMNKPRSKFIDAVTDGWPQILSSLKSFSRRANH
jgi:hypothetical protein